MRVLVCGDRDYTDGDLILTCLKIVKNLECVIEGEQRGADTLAREAAESLDVEVASFPANWKKFHRAAGPIRNAQMLKEGKPDYILAFHDDIEGSKGTKNMIGLANKAGILVYLVSRCHDSSWNPSTHHDHATLTIVEKPEFTTMVYCDKAVTVSPSAGLEYNKP